MTEYQPFSFHEKKYSRIVQCFLSFGFFALQDSARYSNSFHRTKIWYEQWGQGTTIVREHGFIVNRESRKRTILYNGLL